MGNLAQKSSPICSDSKLNSSGNKEDKADTLKSIYFRKISTWSLSSFSERFSFRRRSRSNSSICKSEKNVKSFRNLHYRKTSWPKPNKDLLFLTQFKCSNDFDNIIIEHKIAEGAFGIVFSAVQNHKSRFPHPLKELEKHKTLPHENSVQQIKDGVEIQKLSDYYPFIVKQFESWQSRSLHMLLEYIPNGELFANFFYFPYELIRVYIAEISLAIDFLHTAGVIYRDVKLENILLSRDYDIKNIDFGLSKWLKFGERTRTMCGTFQYMVRFKRMNTRSQVFDLACEGRQVDEAVSSIFHTVLFHRCQGKFEYERNDESYTMGAIGFTDIDCHFIDFTYVCVTSEILRQTVKTAVSVFSEKLRSDESTGTGQISLEFFQKKKRSALLGTIECVPWEVWTVKIEIVNHNNEDDRQMSRELVGETLSEKVIYISEVMNRYDYVPRAPPKSELDWVYNTQIPEVQPYLFKIDHSTSTAIIPSMGSAMKKIIKETLSL